MGCLPSYSSETPSEAAPPPRKTTSRRSNCGAMRATPLSCAAMRATPLSSAGMTLASVLVWHQDPQSTRAIHPPPRRVRWTRPKRHRSGQKTYLTCLSRACQAAAAWVLGRPAHAQRFMCTLQTNTQTRKHTNTQTRRNTHSPRSDLQRRHMSGSMTCHAE